MYRLLYWKQLCTAHATVTFLFQLRSNVLETTDKSYLKRCRYDEELHPYCPIFRLGDITRRAGYNFQDMSTFVSVTLCNLDVSWARLEATYGWVCVLLPRAGPLVLWLIGTATLTKATPTAIHGTTSLAWTSVSPTRPSPPDLTSGETRCKHCLSHCNILYRIFATNCFCQSVWLHCWN